jgi:hypothetical protein
MLGALFTAAQKAVAVCEVIGLGMKAVQKLQRASNQVGSSHTHIIGTSTAYACCDNGMCAPLLTEQPCVQCTAAVNNCLDHVLLCITYQCSDTSVCYICTTLHFQNSIGL